MTLWLFVHWTEQDVVQWFRSWLNNIIKAQMGLMISFYAATLALSNAAVFYLAPEQLLIPILIAHNTSNLLYLILNIIVVFIINLTFCQCVRHLLLKFCHVEQEETHDNEPSKEAIACQDLRTTRKNQKNQSKCPTCKTCGLKTLDIVKGVFFVFLASLIDLVLLVTVAAFFVKMCFGEKQKSAPKGRSPRFEVNFNELKGGSETSEKK